jgi:hypothetical protein
VTSELASFHELQTVYSTEDMFNLMEIAAVNAHNRWLASKKNE